MKAVDGDTVERAAERVFAEVDEGELAVRLFAIFCKEGRPPGLTATQILSSFESEDRRLWLAAARVAFEYINSCAIAAQREQ